MWIDPNPLILPQSLPSHQPSRTKVVGDQEVEDITNSRVTLGTTMAPGINNHHSSHHRGETTSTEEEEEGVEGVTSTSKVILSYTSRFHESFGKVEV